jgi:enamine deaminase RidA (YjgF/YER057c/UK114 family)
MRTRRRPADDVERAPGAPFFITGEGTMAKKQLIRTVDSAKLGMPGSSGVRAECYRAGNWVYMAGQTGFDLEGNLVGVGDPAAQARQACENIKAMLEMAGGQMSDVIKLVVYITDREYRHAAYPVIRSFFEEPRPAQTGVVVAGLARPELLIEVEAVAFIDDPDD